MSALLARDVFVRLSGVEILHDVDLNVKEGQVVAILGANGSGKSTLVRTMLGIIPVSSGQVEVFGQPVGSGTPWADIGYVPQRIGAGSGVPVSVREVVTSGLLHGKTLRAGRAAKAAVAAAMEAVHIEELANRTVTELSGGQQQRTLIARALVRKPRLLVLDEPIAGLDVPSHLALAETLKELNEAGTTLVLVLHELGAFRPLIDRTVVLRGGTIIHRTAFKPNGREPSETSLEHDHVHPHEDPSDPADWLAPELRLEP